MSHFVPVCMQVYDVTNFWAQHPGGKVILTYAGRDATDVFATFHSPATWSQLKHLCIGRLEVLASRSDVQHAGQEDGC